MKEKITIYTDGSAKGNPGPAGWGVVILSSPFGGGREEVIELGGRSEHATNNQMELQAAIEALKYLQNSPRQDLGKVQIFADSKYVVLGITEWIFNWQKNGWRGANKKRVLNRGLWEELFELAKGLNLKWDYVEGHNGDKWNDRADEIATSFADNEPVKLKK